MLGSLPAWAVGAVFDLLEVIIKLVTAADDEQRELALMQGAEALKARMDQRKFGG